VAGHLIPGSAFFLLTAFIWFLCRAAQNQSSSSSTLQSAQRRLPVAYGMFLCISTSIGLLAEMIDSHGSQSDSWMDHISLSKEHCTMYLAFLITGIAALLESKGRCRPHSWRLFLAASFSVEGFLFYMHSLMQHDMDHSMTEALLHWILAIISFVAAGSFALSVANAEQALEWTVFASAFALLEGVWFYFVAWSMYSGVYGDAAMMMDVGAVGSF